MISRQYNIYYITNILLHLKGQGKIDDSVVSMKVLLKLNCPHLSFCVLSRIDGNVGAITFL